MSAILPALVQSQGRMAGRNRRFAMLDGRQPERACMDRAAKKELVASLNGVFKASNVVVVAHYSGLTVAQMQTLRKQMKQAGAR